MRATLIHNPTAGDERPSADDLRSILRAAGFQVRYQSSKKDWKKAIKQDADVIVVAGGDGTVADVLKHVAGRRLPIGLLPVGTANNICRSLGVVGDAREIVAGWRMGRTRPFDVGVVSHDGSDERFVEGCGGGVFAALLDKGKETVEEASAFVGNEMDRALVLLDRLLEKAKPQRWQVEVDDKDLSGEYLTVEVLNIQFAGPSVPLAPRADPGDGLLDIVLIGGPERNAIREYLQDRLERKSAEAPTLEVHRGRQASLQPSKRVPLRVDDELSDADSRHSLEITLEPGAVEVLIGAERG